MSDTASALLALPPELRSRIWDLALPASPDECLFPALLQTCRFIRDEGTTFFYGRKRYGRLAPRDLQGAGSEVEGVEVSTDGLVKEMPWWERVRVTAVECEVPGVALVPPPFPFRQRWDATFQGLRRWGKREGKNRKRKRKEGKRSGGFDVEWYG